MLNSVDQKMADASLVTSPDEDFAVVQQFLQKGESSSFGWAEVQRWVRSLAVNHPGVTQQEQGAIVLKTSWNNSSYFSVSDKYVNKT